MSVVARRLSACVPQEAFARRASPTAQDLASQIKQLDATCFSPRAEENGASVERGALTPLLITLPAQEFPAPCSGGPSPTPCSPSDNHVSIPALKSVGAPYCLSRSAARRLSGGPGEGQKERQCLDHHKGRRRSFDITWLSAQVLPVDKRRGSLRAPVWRAEQERPTSESRMRPDVFPCPATSSTRQLFFGRALRLHNELNEGGSPSCNSARYTGHSLRNLDFLTPSLPGQQRRKSWGPAVFTPSPVATPVHTGLSPRHHLDLSPCPPSQPRQQGPAVFFTSPDNTRFQTTFDTGSRRPVPTPSPNTRLPQYLVARLPTSVQSVPSGDPYAEEDTKGGGNEGPSLKRLGAVIALDRRSSSRIMPNVISTGSSKAWAACCHGGHSEQLGTPSPGHVSWAWGEPGAACLPGAQPRRASWHTLATTVNKDSVPIGRCPRYKAGYHLGCRDAAPAREPLLCPSNFLSETAGAAFRCSNLSSLAHSACPGSVLGKGGFGIVKLGNYKGRGVAVKVLKGRRATATSSREAKVLCIPPHAHLALTLAVISHVAKGLAKVSWADVFGKEEEVVSQKTVTSMFSLSLEDAQGNGSGEQQQDEGGAPRWAWVVSELCLPHTLLTLINDTSITLTSEMRVRYTVEVTRGLAHLHAHGLAHRDLKPTNLLLTVTGRLKIADFGCCAKLDVHDDDDNVVLGTARYQAPEVLRGEVGGSHSDVFSLGVTTWHLLTRTVPFHGLHPHTVIYKVAHLHHRPPDHQPHPGPRTFHDAVLWRIVHSCWAEEPAQRPTAATLARNLTLLYLASSPHSVSGVPDNTVSHSNSPSAPSLPRAPPSSSSLC